MQAQCCGFLYFTAYAEDGNPIAVMWMTPRQRELLLHYGDVLFIDWKWGGGNDLCWPWAGPSILDQENKLRTVASCLYSTESEQAYRYGGDYSYVHVHACNVCSSPFYVQKSADVSPANEPEQILPPQSRASCPRTGVR
jgi:hypothetical protein